MLPQEWMPAVPDHDPTVLTKRSGKTFVSPWGRAEWSRDIKAYYDAVANEPIPDRIQDLMASLLKAARK
jgi:hypothetical protein